MTNETKIALINYDALVRYKGLDDVTLAWESNTLVYGDGGVEMKEILRPGFMPETEGMK